MPVSDPKYSQIKIPTKPCHNCRRSRLRCDRSLPGCEKCHAKGESCLGYGQLLRWTGAVAVRGKLAKQIPQQQQPPCKVLQKLSAVLTLHTGDEGKTTVTNLPALQFSLVDPLLQDLGPRNRVYISHCKSSVFADPCHKPVILLPSSRIGRRSNYTIFPEARSIVSTFPCDSLHYLFGRHLVDFLTFCG